MRRQPSLRHDHLGLHGHLGVLHDRRRVRRDHRSRLGYLLRIRHGFRRIRHDHLGLHQTRHVHRGYRLVLGSQGACF
jgi:hypothetical protein